MRLEHLLPEKKNVARTRSSLPKQAAQDLPSAARGPLSTHQIVRLQQTVGNTAVQRFLVQRSGQGPAPIDEEIATAINSQRDSGGQLDETLAARAGQTMGQDFSNVTVHTDRHADHLSRQLGAEAFTTGQDIFFREGAYDPVSSSGQRLIAHELTHVAQQGGAASGVQTKMTVNDPNDAYEAEADRVAELVMAQPAAPTTEIQAQEEEEELQMQEVAEEEPLQMQEVPEEEEMQM